MPNLFWLGWASWNHFDLIFLRHLTYLRPFEFMRNNFSWTFSHAEGIPRPPLCANYLDKHDLLAIQIQRVFEFKWITNPKHHVLIHFVHHFFHMRNGFSWKLSTHKRAHTSLFSCVEWIGMSWLAFEFKFDLNLNEQPLILSCGKNAAKMRSCIILKRR